MRWKEIAGGLLTPVSNEENELCETIRKDGKMELAKLDERQQEIARRLVSRGVLNISHESNKSYVSNNEIEEIWRI